MKADESNITRRDAVVLGTRWLFAGSVVSVVAVTPRAYAAKAAKADFSYQERPKEGKSCSNCKLFIVGESGKGSCAIVDGEISPSGWCLAYSPSR
jgi:hypothetical protein